MVSARNRPAKSAGMAWGLQGYPESSLLRLRLQLPLPPLPSMPWPMVLPRLLP
jgi:hypothetical protein